MDKTTITIEIPTRLKKAIEDEARRCFFTTSELICHRMGFCLPENIARDIKKYTVLEDNKIPVTVLFDDDFINLVEKVSKKNFCNRGTFIRRGTFELLEKLVPEKANALKLVNNTKPPYTPQIDHRHADNVKEYVQKVCKETGRPEGHVITDLVLTGMEAKALS